MNYAYHVHSINVSKCFRKVPQFISYLFSSGKSFSVLAAMNLKELLQNDFMTQRKAFSTKIEGRTSWNITSARYGGCRVILKISLATFKVKLTRIGNPSCQTLNRQVIMITLSMITMIRAMINHSYIPSLTVFNYSLHSQSINLFNSATNLSYMAIGAFVLIINNSKKC